MEVIGHYHIGIQGDVLPYDTCMEPFGCDNGTIVIQQHLPISDLAEQVPLLVCADSDKIRTRCRIIKTN